MIIKIVKLIGGEHAKKDYCPADSWLFEKVVIAIFQYRDIALCGLQSMYMINSLVIYFREDILLVIEFEPHL